MKTILAYIHALRQTINNLAFECHAMRAEKTSPHTAFEALEAQLTRIWALWAKEVTVRYFELKQPNISRQIPYSGSVGGMSKERALEVIATDIQTANELIEKNPSLAATGIILAPVFQAFAEYKTDPLPFHKQLLTLAKDAESYLLEMQYELHDASMAS